MKNKGFTLIELMIVIVIGLIALGGIITIICLFIFGGKLDDKFEEREVLYQECVTACDPYKPELDTHDVCWCNYDNGLIAPSALEENNE